MEELLCVNFQHWDWQIFVTLLCAREGRLVSMHWELEPKAKQGWIDVFAQLLRLRWCRPGMLTVAFSIASCIVRAQQTSTSANDQGMLDI